MTFINFDEINLCTDIVNYVESINGAESNSASPTDTWILTFKPDAPIYHRYKRINNCFFKIFIDPSTIIEPSYEHLEYLNALTYELNVYSDVIYPLIKNNVCSNFVKYLSSGTNCTYNNLLQLYDDKKVLEEKISTQTNYVNEDIQTVLNKFKFTSK